MSDTQFFEVKCVDGKCISAELINAKNNNSNAPKYMSEEEAKTLISKDTNVTDMMKKEILKKYVSKDKVDNILSMIKGIKIPPTVDDTFTELSEKGNLGEHNTIILYSQLEGPTQHNTNQLGGKRRASKKSRRASRRASKKSKGASKTRRR
jgi:hypothetical protein